jgi:alkyl sulfatase BDS1-like metallo-beta-lactamase superfamily hydrolase
MAKLAGGKDKLMEAAREALKYDDPQWAAQLTDHLIALDPTAKEPKLLKADALMALGYRTVTATARNYYLTVARELRDDAKSQSVAGRLKGRQ